MTLVNDDCVCGLCETSGCDVQQSPGTFHRILQALDLNKLPQLLTEETLRQRIGLCKDCEKRIKVLEEAASVRANLKEYFVANLKQLTGSYETCCTADSKSSSHTLQKTNEITPDQHSMKRKISSLQSSLNEAAFHRRKQLKSHHNSSISRLLPTSPASLHESNNSSDEENIHSSIDRLSPVSPHSSSGSYTPPVSLIKPGQSTQVLAELTSSRNRRKQARPSKAAGDVLRAIPKLENAATPAAGETIRSRPVSPRCMQRSTASPAVPAKRSPSPAIAKLPHLGLPFSNTLYQSMLPGHNLASNAQANSALLLAQTLCNNKPLMAINNPMILGATLPVVSNANHPFNKSMLSLTSLANTTSPGLLIAAKQEASPTIPMFNYSLPNPSASMVAHKSGAGRSPTSVSAAAATSNGSSDPMLAKSADLHTLMKTDKRRYCKVCAASSRKANNGRPPQSRFLCVICSMPMCRSCIEEHRYRIVMKVEEDSENKTSASARLLQAVKMKDKANVTAVKTIPAHLKPSVLASAPPSNSSLIYGPLSSESDSTTASRQVFTTSRLPGIPTLTSSSSALPTLASRPTSRLLDVKRSETEAHSVPNPMQPKIKDDPAVMIPSTRPEVACAVTSGSADSGACDVDDEEDDEEDRLVISERDEEGSECSDDEGGKDEMGSSGRKDDDENMETEISPETVNSTAAMLDEGMVRGVSNKQNSTFQLSNQPNLTLLNQKEEDGVAIADKSASNIPVGPCALIA